MRKFINIVESISAAQQLVAACRPLNSDYITLSMSVDDECNVSIDDFWSELERGKGHASAAMKQVSNLADQFGVTLWLTAHPLHYDTQWGDYDDDPRDVNALNKQALDTKRLIQFYEKFGFKVVYGDEEEPVMERKPNA